MNTKHRKENFSPVENSGHSFEERTGHSIPLLGEITKTDSSRDRRLQFARQNLFSTKYEILFDEVRHFGPSR